MRVDASARAIDFAKRQIDGPMPVTNGGRLVIVRFQILGKGSPSTWLSISQAAL
jgi:hypothetical protein